MKRFCLILALLLPNAAHAQQWGNPPSAVAPQQFSTIEWQFPDGDEWCYLYQYGQIKGAYHIDHGYRPWISYGVWGPATTCPVVPPIGQQPDWKTHGVKTDKLSDTLKITRKGYEIDVDEAAQALLLEGAKGQLVDDSAKPTMVVVGAQADRQRVKDAIAGSDRLKSALKNWKAQYAPPDHWHLRDWPQKKTGTPWIIWLRPDKSNPKQADTIWEITALPTLATAAEADLFAAVKEANDRLDPNWKPPAPPTPKTPDPKTPNIPPIPLPDVSGIPPNVWVLGAALLALIAALFKKRQS